VLSPLAFIIANLIILWTGWDTDWKLGVCILIGYAVLILNRVLKLNKVPVNFSWRHALWLPPYLVFLGLIVFLSDFGPLHHPVLKLWYDMGAIAVLSLVIYYWAIYTSSDTETIEATVARSADPLADSALADEPFE
jgi:hypothetical protein